jgi:hypothetical protein
MAWGKNGTTTQTVAATTLTTSTFTATTFNFIAVHAFHAGAANPLFRVGNTTIDSGSNYAFRRSYDGGAENLATSQTELQMSGVGATQDTFYVLYSVNIAAEEKLFIANQIRQNSAGAGNAPHRRELVGKWVDTSNQFDIVQAVASTGDISNDSNITVLGDTGQTAVTAKIQDGLIFEETDTNKHYIYTASTDTWTEI